jgi:iron-sulfur cluster assembly protein
MVALTDSAANAIRQVFEAAETPPAGLRIMAESGGCAGWRYRMGLDSEVMAGDAVLRMGDITLLIDAESLPVLEGVRVDFVSTAEGAGFVIENPHTRLGCSSCASHTC